MVDELVKSNRPLDPPRETWVDQAHQMTVTTVNVLTGGAGGTILSMIVGPPLNKRRQEFEEEVAARIEELQRQGRIDREKLSEHGQFISTYVKATLAAVQTHNQEKLESLRNAILNSALTGAPDETRQSLFIRWIDELSEAHMLVLTKARTTNYRPDQAQALLSSLPEVRALNMLQVIENDLVARHLIRTTKRSGVFVERGEVWATSLGCELLDFIMDPIAAKNAAAQ